MFVLWLILAALAVLVAVVLVRTVRFTPGPSPAGGLLRRFARFSGGLFHKS